MPAPLHQKILWPKETMCGVRIAGMLCHPPHPLPWGGATPSLAPCWLNDTLCGIGAAGMLYYPPPEHTIDIREPRKPGRPRKSDGLDSDMHMRVSQVCLSHTPLSACCTALFLMSVHLCGCRNQRGLTLTCTCVSARSAFLPHTTQAVRYHAHACQPGLPFSHTTQAVRCHAPKRQSFSSLETSDRLLRNACQWWYIQGKCLNL